MPVIWFNHLIYDQSVPLQSRYIKQYYFFPHLSNTEGGKKLIFN